MAETRWAFGVAPLPESLAFASLTREVTGLALSLETSHPALDRLVTALRDAQNELARLVPPSPLPRFGGNVTVDGRVYLDHSRDIGAYNPCFPTYEIRVDGDRASGTVTFPLAFEGPPGIVNGGFLAVFFDSVIQHHNCDVGVAGKTTSLTINYRRPTPLVTALRFEIERSVVDRRIMSTAQLLAGENLLCEAQMSAVAGNLDQLPPISPRRGGV